MVIVTVGASSAEPYPYREVTTAAPKAADGAMRASCWSGDAGAGMLSMALNPTEAPCELECVTKSPVSTGSFRQHVNVLHLSPWSAVAW